MRAPARHGGTIKRSSGSILRWAGSKRKLLPRLLPYADGFSGKYIEPFVGSAVLFHELAPEEAVLSDANEELILAYHAIAARPLDVYERIVACHATKEEYLRFRGSRPESMDEISRTARFFFLNRYCFNGLYRTNRAGSFNVPYAPQRSGSFPSWEAFRDAAARLAKATVLRADFETTLERYAAKGDFVYLDPPYAVANRRIFRQYGPETFGLEDLERLASCLYALDALGVRFLVSYAYCAEARSVFRGWRQSKVFTQRNIAGFVSSRRTAAELLVTNREE